MSFGWTTDLKEKSLLCIAANLALPSMLCVYGVKRVSEEPHAIYCSSDLSHSRHEL